MVEYIDLKSQIEELCKANSIQYHFKDDYAPPVVLINDKFVFNIDTNIDMDNIECYINIITGKNEMVNMICETLNVHIKDGSYLFKAYEYFQGEDGCVNENTITMCIFNDNDEEDFPYKNLIIFELKIYVGHRFNKYYLVNKDKTEVEVSKKMLDGKCSE
jgi:hypothetical protein